ncbi:MAG: hypothetical protein L3J07_02550 [Candidatus Magasanikbacteria bacterium]|nr:hypothetical protein [Candidatus Magasanikbacteria bacterium]
MNKKIKIIIAFIVAVTAVGGFLYFNSLDNQQMDEVPNDVVVDNGEYTNNKIGFTVNIPKNFEFKEERNDVKLYSEGGPVGDSIYFEKDDKRGVFIFHVDSYNAGVFEKFEDYHKGDPVLVEEKEDLAWNASVITHGLGTILIFTPENTNEYFEFNISREVENPKEFAKTMLESFKQITK